jgi:hypothetical protein
MSSGKKHGRGKDGGTRRAIPGVFAEKPAAHFRGEQKGAGPSRRTHGPAKPLNAHQTIKCWPTQKSRTQIRKSRRRIRTEPGPAGDRQAVLAHISQLYGAEKPVVPSPEETLTFPVARFSLGCHAHLTPGSFR